MAHAFKVEKFEGPLDLLLKLVEQEELPITDISLAQITDQYIEFIEHTKNISKEELADFLLIAARLLLIKSRILLPSLVMPLEDVGVSLEEQLRMYKQFVDAAKKIEVVLKQKRFTYPREKAPVQAGMFSPPKTLTSARLLQVFREVLRALEPIVRFPKAAVERIVSIQEKISEIHELLKSQGVMSFHTFVRAAKSPTEVVVTFLALLELVKQRIAFVSQDVLFTDITIAHAESKNESPVS